MKAASLWQPWASAMALGLKGNETRHWWTSYRGPLAIHAAKKWTKELRDFAEEMGLSGEIPLGAFVAIGDLVDVVRTESIREKLTELERSWGDYSDERYCWIFENVRALAAPIPFKGMQGLFEVPDELLGRASLPPAQGTFL